MVDTIIGCFHDRIQVCRRWKAQVDSLLVLRGSECAFFCVRRRVMEMCHAVALSARTAGVSLSGICRHTSAGRASTAGLGCTSAGRWHTRLQPGRLQTLLRLAKWPIFDNGPGRPDDNVYRDECIRRTDLLLCREDL